MLGIVLPLKSKRVSNNWQLVCQNLEKSIASIQNQTDSNFDFIVVGHEAPDSIKEMQWNGNPVFHSIEEVSPPLMENPTQLDYERDRVSKIAKGIQLIKSRNKKVNYWYPVDADDLLHKELVSTVNQSKQVAGFSIQNGFKYYAMNNRIILEKEMHAWCGSTGIVADEHINCPTTISHESIRSLVFCRYTHMGLTDFFEKELKLPFIIPEQPLLAYSIDHGENLSLFYRQKLIVKIKSKLKPYIKGQRANQAFYENFSLNKKIQNL